MRFDWQVRVSVLSTEPGTEEVLSPAGVAGDFLPRLLPSQRVTAGRLLRPQGPSSPPRKWGLAQSTGRDVLGVRWGLKSNYCFCYFLRKHWMHQLSGHAHDRAELFTCILLKPRRRLYLPILQMRLTHTEEMYFLGNGGAGVQPQGCGASNPHAF